MAQWGRICLPVQEMQESRVWRLGGEDALEMGMAAHWSTLACRNVWTKEPDRAQGITKSGTWLSTHTELVIWRFVTHCVGCLQGQGSHFPKCWEAGESSHFLRWLGLLAESLPRNYLGLGQPPPSLHPQTSPGGSPKFQFSGPKMGQPPGANSASQLSEASTGPGFGLHPRSASPPAQFCLTCVAPKSTVH